MTVTTQPIAFRCSKCFQTSCSTSDCVGQPAQCNFCGQSNIVPEATPDRISQAIEFLEQASAAPAAGNVFSEPSVDMSDAEIMRQAKLETYGNSNPSAMVCSKTKRFIGAIVDGIAAVATFVVGAILAAIIAPATGSPEEPNLLAAAILFGLPIMLGIVQMILVATEGRTLGKYCVNTKIVTADGSVPGFIQGVFMRVIVNALLGIIPFYGLIDLLAIFTNDTHRCVHDFIAGTYVVDCH